MCGCGCVAVWLWGWIEQVSMGEQYLSPPPFDLAGSHADSSVSQPLVFVLSPGSDPMAALLYFADTVKKKVDSISLGQGQASPYGELIMSLLCCFAVSHSHAATPPPQHTHTSAHSLSPSPTVTPCACFLVVRVLVLVLMLLPVAVPMSPRAPSPTP
jgi:hypothetical protein